MSIGVSHHTTFHIRSKSTYKIIVTTVFRKPIPGKILTLLFIDDESKFSSCKTNLLGICGVVVWIDAKHRRALLLVLWL